MPARLRPLRAGEQLREPWIHTLVQTVNELTERVARLESLEHNIGDAAMNQQLVAAGAVGGGGSMPTSLTWTATSRSSATKTLTDSNSDTATYQQATRFVMTASDGTNSYSWTFNYPT